MNFGEGWAWGWSHYGLWHSFLSDWRHMHSSDGRGSWSLFKDCHQRSLFWTNAGGWRQEISPHICYVTWRIRRNCCDLVVVWHHGWSQLCPRDQNGQFCRGGSRQAPQVEIGKMDSEAGRWLSGSVEGWALESDRSGLTLTLLPSGYIIWSKSIVFSGLPFSL